MKILAFFLGVSMAIHAAVKVEKVEYKGWPNCYRVSNGEVELVVTSDVGPRVIRFGFVGGQNLFKEFPEQLGGKGEDAVPVARRAPRLEGARRSGWHRGPPTMFRFRSRSSPDGLVAREPVEPLTKLQKEIAVRMAPSGTEVEVLHRITNQSLFPLEFAAWAMSMMAQGGMAITGFPPRGRHPINLEATNPLVMWAYTDLSDNRWKFTKKYMMLRQDPKIADAQKLGLFNPHTWVAYVLNGEAFVKQARADAGSAYPDFGCSFETFTNDEFLEIETLSPLTKVLPTRAVEHTEHWSLHRNVRLSNLTDEELDRVILPLLQPAPAVGR